MQYLLQLATLQWFRPDLGPIMMGKNTARQAKFRYTYKREKGKRGI